MPGLALAASRNAATLVAAVLGRLVSMCSLALRGREQGSEIGRGRWRRAFAEGSYGPSERREVLEGNVDFVACNEPLDRVIIQPGR